MDRLLVVMPTWVGDVVMATPTLRALRELYPNAKITAMVRPMVEPVLDPCPWINSVEPWPVESGVVSMARRLEPRKFDMAILLPNSLRAAFVARLAGIKRIVGYGRAGRSWLLTDRLEAAREVDDYIPVPTVQYYLDIVRRLGATAPEGRMELFTRPQHDAAAMRLLAGVNGRMVLLNPGANFGAAKMWPPARFAAVADRLARERGMTVTVSGSPKERGIADAVVRAAKTPVINLIERGVDLLTLKSIVKKCTLMITNDTGPRHIAAAMNVPVVTVFGPTDPAWTEIDFDRERQVRLEVSCSPCQRKVCPWDHRCMTQLSADMVFDQAAALLDAG